MQGPYPAGTHKRMIELTPWEEGRLVRGERYRVVKAFVDADGDPHPAGEEWFFIASMFSPLDDELLVAIRKDTTDEWRILLVWRPQAQQQVIENFHHYVTPCA